MLNCIYFGLFVLLIMFLVPQGAKLCRTPKAKNIYNYVLFTIYGGGVLWLTLVNRLDLDVSRIRWQLFYNIRLLINCALKTNKYPAYVCKTAFKNSKHLFDSIHATPIEDLLLNIILFMPLGFLLPYIWPKLNWWKTVLLSFCVSTVIEATQYLAHWGCLDLDDIINNTLGACVGYLCFKIYKRLSR